MSKQNIFTPGEGYYTKSNNPVTIYAVYTTEIHGAVFAEGKWNSRVWHSDGRYSVLSHVWDIRPPKRELWVNVYALQGYEPAGDGWSSLADAETHKSGKLGQRIARIRVEYTEGQFDE